jgi:hypothetical protein
VAFPFKCTALGNPDGTVIVPSQRYIAKELQVLMGRNGRHARDPGPYTSADCEKYIREQRLHDAFKSLIRYPDDVAKRWAFHRFIDASKRFHILRPIVIETDFDEFAISKFLDVLTAIGLKPITAPQLRAMTNKGLVSCSCELYLEHAWCHHSCTFACPTLYRALSQLSLQTVLENCSAVVCS